MPKELILDTRELEAPEPMSVVLSALHKLNENTFIKMIHRIEPLMLYTHLINNDIHHKIVWQKDEVFIYIWNDSFKEKNRFKDII